MNNMRMWITFYKTIYKREKSRESLRNTTTDCRLLMNSNIALSLHDFSRILILAQVGRMVMKSVDMYYSPSKILQNV